MNRRLLVAFAFLVTLYPSMGLARCWHEGPSWARVKVCNSENAAADIKREARNAARSADRGLTEFDKNVRRGARDLGRDASRLSEQARREAERKVREAREAAERARVAAERTKAVNRIRQETARESQRIDARLSGRIDTYNKELLSIDRKLEAKRRSIEESRQAGQRRVQRQFTDKRAALSRDTRQAAAAVANYRPTHDISATDAAASIGMAQQEAASQTEALWQSGDSLEFPTGDLAAPSGAAARGASIGSVVVDGVQAVSDAATDAALTLDFTRYSFYVFNVCGEPIYLIIEGIFKKSDAPPDTLVLGPSPQKTYLISPGPGLTFIHDFWHKGITIQSQYEDGRKSEAIFMQLSGFKKNIEGVPCPPTSQARAGSR